MSGEIGKILCWMRTKIKETYDDYCVRCLITDAYSSRQSTRLLARAKLKMEHPDIFNMLDGEKKA